jgi:hypothetical protein
MVITYRNDGRLYGSPWGRYTVFDGMPLLQEQFQSVPGLKRLDSFWLEVGTLGWKIDTLPCLKTLCLGNAAYVALPRDKSMALNVTHLVLRLYECPLFSKAENIGKLLNRLPNLKHLELLSIQGRLTRQDAYQAQGFIYMDHLNACLKAASSIEELTSKYEEPVSFWETTHIQLSLTQFIRLRRVQLVESGLVGRTCSERPANTAPVDILPPNIRSLVVTHPTSIKTSEYPVNLETRLLDWLGELHRSDFPGLVQIEVQCSRRFGDDVGVISEAYERAAAYPAAQGYGRRGGG